MKCSDCGLEVNVVVHCSHCDKWICETCGWSNHGWLSKYEQQSRQEQCPWCPGSDLEGHDITCRRPMR